MVYCAGGCGLVLFTYDDGHTEEADITLVNHTTIEIVALKDTRFRSKPIGVSYGQGDYPLMTVYNSMGAPLIPFVVSLENL